MLLIVPQFIRWTIDSKMMLLEQTCATYYVTNFLMSDRRWTSTPPKVEMPQEAIRRDRICQCTRNFQKLPTLSAAAIAVRREGLENWASTCQKRIHFKSGKTIVSFAFLEQTLGVGLCMVRIGCRAVRPRSNITYIMTVLFLDTGNIHLCPKWETS